MDWFVRKECRHGAGRCAGRERIAGARIPFVAAAFFLGLVAALATATLALATNYVYDANGRLVAATNDGGESAHYVYDDMGNLLQVERLGAGDLAIFAFSPGRGAPGVHVRVQGHGFSGNPSDNVLRFNGVSAAVVAATHSELIATVPATATTGPLSVTVAGKTATSAADFVVDESLQPPSIHAVSPLIGSEGTSITVTGDSLTPVIGQTTVRLSQQLAAPDSITGTQIVFPIPANANSGKVSVGTPFGLATSAQDVVVVPVGVDPAQVEQIKRILIDGEPSSFLVSASGNYAAALFDGVVGDYISANFTNVSSGIISYYLYDTRNSRIEQGTVSTEAAAVHFKRLRATGTYLLLMQVQTTGTSWNLQLKRDLSISVDGDIKSLSTFDRNSQRITFRASAGERLGFGVRYISIPDNARLNVQVRRPDDTIHGAAVACYNISGNYFHGGCGINLQVPATGTYSIVFSPQGNFDSSFEVALSSDVAGLLELEEIQEIELDRPGQNASLTFMAAHGDTLALFVGINQAVSPENFAYYSVYSPGGVFLTSGRAYTGMTPNGVALNLPDLPTTGEYRIFIDPDHGATASASVVLERGVVREIEIDGHTQSYMTSMAAQSVYAPFHAQAGQKLGLGIDADASFSGRPLQVAVHGPGGDQIGSTHCSLPHCGMNLSISASGAHLVVMTPYYDNHTIDANMTLSSDIIGELQHNALDSFVTERYGQNGRYYFSADEGETLALRVSNVVGTPDHGVYFTVYKPTGTLLASSLVTDATAITMEDLPESGSYLLFIDPVAGAAAMAHMSLIPGGVEELVVDGDSKSIETLVPGAHAYINFHANQGQRLGLGVSDVSVSGGGGAYVLFYATAPSGTGVIGTHAGLGGVGYSFTAPETGTYSISAVPSDESRTMSFRLTLSEEIVSPINKGETKYLSLRYGQTARFIFSDMAGELLRLVVANHQTTPSNRSMNYRINRPNGSQWIVGTIRNSGQRDIGSLTSGSYTLSIDSQNGSEMYAEVTLSER